MTAQGHPRAIFKRAIEHGYVVAVAAREFRNLTLAETLALMALVAQKDIARGSR